MALFAFLVQLIPMILITVGAIMAASVLRRKFV
ncbi:hypothetical protein [Brevibacterium aurantiacum]|nr:hypothetical protein [Brevibacterium aurantiacum]